jgi:carbamoyltransferase
VGTVRPEWRERLPAVCHVDGSARVQTVTRDDNPRFYDVLAALGRETGVAVALNTSMNVQGEPIVETPGDGLRFLNTTQVDALFLDDYVCARNQADLASVLS